MKIKKGRGRTMVREKEWLYVGHYVDLDGHYILKVGTTNDLKRRQSEHTRNYKRSPRAKMPEDSSFTYDWSLRLSKYNTLRYEDKTKANWKNLGFGEYIRNDRFDCGNVKPAMVEITIRKTYQIFL